MEDTRKDKGVLMALVQGLTLSFTSLSVGLTQQLQHCTDPELTGSLNRVLRDLTRLHDYAEEMNTGSPLGQQLHDSCAPVVQPVRDRLSLWHCRRQVACCAPH